VLKRDVKLQLTNIQLTAGRYSSIHYIFVRCCTLRRPGRAKVVRSWQYV